MDTFSQYMYDIIEKQFSCHKIITIHSSISKEDQQEMFEYNNKYRKIILSTNIAESSITIPDVRIVIDSCYIKENV